MEISAKINNAAPMVIQLGTLDGSKPSRTKEDFMLPQHLPLVYTFAQKGAENRHLIDNVSKNTVFGDMTFDYRKKWTTHASVLLNEILKTGNMCIVERVLPEDIRPEANLMLCLEVIKCDVDIYDRDSEKLVRYAGGIAPIPHTTYSSTSKLMYDPTEPKAICYGYKTRVLLTYRDDMPGSGDTNRDPDLFGKALPWNKQWSDTGEVLTVWDPIYGSYQETVVKTATVYPIFEMKARSKGDWGNNIGIRFYAPVPEERPFPKDMMKKEKTYPYVFRMVTREDKHASPLVTRNKFDQIWGYYTLRPNTINPFTNDLIYVEDRLIQSYENQEDPNYAYMLSDFSAIHCYAENVEHLVTRFHTAESRVNYALEIEGAVCDGALYGGIYGGAPVPMSLMESNDPKLDFTADDEDRHLFNIFGLTAMNGTQYHSVQLAPGNIPQHIVLTKMTNLMAKGGSDGTLDEGYFDGEVARRISDYADVNSQFTDLALNPESIFYDSGFTIRTKKKLPKFIAERKDTFLVLSTYTDTYFDPNSLTYTRIPDNSSINSELVTGQSLRTTMQMYPESEYFGTPTMRGMIVAQSCQLINPNYRRRLPLTIEVAIKAARYMGNKTGKWREGYGFTSQIHANATNPGSKVAYVENLSMKYVPAAARNDFWDHGIVYAVANNMKEFFFPAFRTVYMENDSVGESVNNSMLLALAIGYINKITFGAWASFTGNEELNDRELTRATNEYVTARTRDIFDGKYTIIPKAIVTEGDSLRGYSWQLPVDIYSQNMDTVMTTYVTSKNMSMLQEDTAATSQALS